jgi:predicted nucleic acid-binding protein
MDARLPEHRHTIAPMRKAVSNGIIMSYTTLVEIAHYMRRLPAEEFLRNMAMIQNLSTLTLVDLNDEITRQALELLPRYSGSGLGGRDCVIIATMRSHGIKDILTHDRTFSNVEGVHVTDPVPPHS